MYGLIARKRLHPVGTRIDLRLAAVIIRRHKMKISKIKEMLTDISNAHQDCEVVKILIREDIREATIYFENKDGKVLADKEKY